MARTAILLAFFLAGACSPPEEGEMRSPKAEGGMAHAPPIRLTAKAPRAPLDTPCRGNLLVRVGKSPESTAYLLVVTGLFGEERRRLAAHTPYPTGAGGEIFIVQEDCAGADAIEIEAQPIHGAALPSRFRVDVGISEQGGSSD